MNRIRSIVMLIAAALAIAKGWQIHRGEMAVLAYGLGAMALLGRIDIYTLLLGF